MGEVGNEQGDAGDDEDAGEQPEADDDRGLRPADHLEVVVHRRDAEQALAAMGGLEHTHLDGDGTDPTATPAADAIAAKPRITTP